MKERARVTTAIWNEKAADDNPFYPRESYCCGYDYYGELLGRFSWTSLLYLQLRGELPDTRQAGFFDLMLSAVMNPGPRDPQNQSAMAAAVGGCPVGGSLMAGFGTSQGSREGGGAVEACMAMLDLLVAGEVVADRALLTERFGDGEDCPGFGLWFGEKDHRAPLVGNLIRSRGYPDRRLSLLETLGDDLRLYGVFAAGLGDLGFTPRQGHGLFMISGGGGMLAFLCEQYSVHWSGFPHWFGYGEYRYEP
jgi:citrate synthase